MVLVVDTKSRHGGGGHCVKRELGDKSGDTEMIGWSEKLIKFTVVLLDMITISQKGVRQETI